jgi:hypothetical protein
MDRSVDIYANIVLSFNGEDMSIDATKDSITITTPSVRSGLRALLNMQEHHRLFNRATELDATLAALGWTLYAHIGIFNIAVLGLKGRRGFLTALIFFGRLGRIVGAV